VALATLTACASFSGIAPQAKALDAQSLGLRTPAATTTTPPELSARWWHEFGDSQLDRLIDQALASNPSLRVVQARLTRTLAASDMASAAGQPQLNTSLDASHQRFTAKGLIPPPLAGAIADTGTLQAAGSWELDLFGKNRAALDSALGQTKAAEADAAAARMLLASNLARTYFTWLRIEAQLQIAQRTLEQRQQTLALVQDRVKAGLDTQLEQQQSESALPDARFQIEALREQKALTLNALAALVSQPNTPLALETHAQAAIKTIAIGSTLPIDLLGRRADIAASRWRIEAASRDVDNARAQFYPNINLTAFAGFSSIGLDKLLQTGSEQWGVGPAIRLPLFDGGRLRANLRGKTADLDAAIESYNALVVDSVREVADQLASTQSIARQQKEQSAALTSAEAAYAIALQRYQAGLGNYLNVLSAETAVLTQRRQAVDLSARALDIQVQLIRALGGGFSPEASALTATNASIAKATTP
jgi:NodT family efflux transporter outer membrane factor (OMF) lipoprotein